MKVSPNYQDERTDADLRRQAEAVCVRRTQEREKYKRLWHEASDELADKTAELEATKAMVRQLLAKLGGAVQPMLPPHRVQMTDTERKFEVYAAEIECENQR